MLGTGMTESSGVFTFPSIGRWYIGFNSVHYKNGDVRYIGVSIQTSINTGSAYTSSGLAYTHITGNGTGSTYSSNYCSAIFDVESISTHRVMFGVSGNPSDFYTGSSWTNATFLRIGDT